ncbi:MAG: hypothetical protein ABNH21_00280 [Glaciecola sp.]
MSSFPKTLQKILLSVTLLLSTFLASATVSITPIAGGGVVNNSPNYTLAWTAAGATSCGSGSSDPRFGGGPQMSPYKIEGLDERGAFIMPSIFTYGRALDIRVPTEVSRDTTYTYKVYAYQCSRFGTGSGSYIFAGQAQVTIAAGGGTGTGGGGNGDGGTFQNGTPPPNVTFVHTDLLGSPVAETDENGDKK